MSGTRGTPNTDKFPDKGSPKLRLGIMKKLEKRNLIQNLYPNLRASEMRPRLVERLYVDDARRTLNDGTNEDSMVETDDESEEECDENKPKTNEQTPKEPEFEIASEDKTKGLMRDKEQPKLLRRK